MPQHRTTVTLLTPPGRGAIATLSIRGSHAVAAVDACFQAVAGKPLAAAALNRILFGRWGKRGEVGEELVVSRIAEEEVEVHCHGGRSAIAAIIASLVQQGVEETASETWVLATEPDRLTTEARLALSAARTERTAKHLLVQYQGALREAGEKIVAQLQRKECEQAACGINELLQRANFGLHLTQPWRVVLAGEPNVGKSSLMNALLGFSRSIVFDTPGTTRDVVSALTAFDGWLVELLDTAGLRTTTDALESAGVALTEQQLALADLVLFVVDASCLLEAANATPAFFLQEPNCLLVFNKLDLVASGSELPISPANCAVSAKSGWGLELLAQRITERLVPHLPANDTAIPFTNRHRELLTLAHRALLKSDLAQAIAQLEDLWR